MLIGGAGIGAVGGSDDQFAHLFLGPVVEQPEGAVGGPIRGNGVVGEPAAVHMAEQIVLRADRGIDVGEVDPGPLSVYRHDTILTMGGSVPCMPDADEVTGPDDERSRVFSGFGIASAVLAVVAVAAVVLIAGMWSGHRAAAAERSYQARSMQVAAEWTGVLINMNTSNVEASLQRLRDGTVGELNAGFEASIAPYRDVVKTLRSRTTGQVESVSIEKVHHDLDGGIGPQQGAPASLAPEFATRTDTVLVVATSVSENVGNTPTTVRWNLRLGVSEVDGTPMISVLESVR